MWFRRGLKFKQSDAARGGRKTEKVREIKREIGNIREP